MSKFILNRRRFISGAAAIGGLAATGNLIGVTAGHAQDVAKIRMQLGWLASNGVLGEVAAITKGFYQEEGLELEIVPGGPNIDGVAGVAAGQATVGLTSSSPAVMLARSAGIPVKAFLAGYQKHPFSYFSLGKNPIKTPQDMIDKTIATQPSAVILLRAMLAANGIAEDQVTVVNMGADMNQLLTGQADAVTGWNTNLEALSILGADAVELMLWDAGLRLNANVYFATDDQLANHGDVLARFARATAKGWGYVRANPVEGVEMLIAAYPNMNRDAELAAVGAVSNYSFSGAAVDEGWGTMNRETWEAQIKSYSDLGQFSGTTPTVDDVADFSVLEATLDARLSVG